MVNEVLQDELKNIIALSISVRLGFVVFLFRKHWFFLCSFSIKH